MGAMDDIDRSIVRATQAGLPLVPQPYAALAAAVGTTQDVVIERLNRMLATGAIRRIAAVPNHYALGFTVNAMTVWDLDDDVLAECGPLVGALEFVSHCYHRPRKRPQWPYNLFAMVHGNSRPEVNTKVDAIAALLKGRARAHDVLLSTKILKKTGFRVAG